MNPAQDPVIDVGDGTFAAAVLERSHTVPVVVDFWAPWCGPCRVIGPVLERLAAEMAGAFILARVNVDENPGLARTYRISGIPHVMGFDKGTVATEFTGAVPESTIREFLQRLLPTEAENLAALGRKKIAAGRFDEAEPMFRKALETDSLNGAALVGLAEIEISRGKQREALELLNRVPPGVDRAEADRLAARLRVQAASLVDEAALRERIAGNAGDLKARLELARAAAAAGRYEEGLAEYLEIVRRDRSFENDAGRLGMLDLFQVLGRDHPLTERYRSELSRELFS